MSAKIWNSRQLNNTFLDILSFPAKPDRFLSFSVVFPLFSFFFFINDEKNFVNVCVELKKCLSLPHRLLALRGKAGGLIYKKDVSKKEQTPTPFLYHKLTW